MQLHEFWNIVVKVTIKRQQERPLWGLIFIHKNMSLGTKLESNGSDNHQKSASMGPRVNLPRLNNILSLNIANLCYISIQFS